MSLNGQRARFDTLRSLAFGSISGAYAAVGTAFGQAVRILKIDNLTDANMIFSFDGINNHTVVPAQSGCVFDFATNKVGPVDQLEQPIGTRVYVKEELGAPSAGNVYVTIVYASSN
jgi:hypothetical protein